MTTRRAPTLDAVRGITRMACPVCFTGDDPILRDSLTAGIGVLVAVTLVVLVAFAAFFVVLARRARAAQADASPPPATAAAPSLPTLPEHAR
ncbi:MAG: hypothetical protein AB7U83_13405 [Vicinamibacterales bacterium]